MPNTAQSSSKQLFEHQNAPQRARGRCARELNCSGFIKSIEDNTAVMRFGSMDHICGRQNASHRTVTGRLPSSLQEHDCRASGRPARRRAMAPSFTGHRVRCMGVLDPPLRQSIEPCCPRGRLRWRRDSGYSHRTVTYLGKGYAGATGCRRGAVCCCGRTRPALLARPHARTDCRCRPDSVRGVIDTLSGDNSIDPGHRDR